MINYVDGDLIEMAKVGTFNVIVHGCNCQNTMGAGIAKTIKREFPDAWRADCVASQLADKPEDLMGGYSWGTTGIFEEMGFKYVINLYTQLHFKGPQPRVSYEAIRQGLALFNRHTEILSHPLQVGICKLGAGLGGGNWETIEQIIIEELARHNVTVVLYNK